MPCLKDILARDASTGYRSARLKSVAPVLRKRNEHSRQQQADFLL